MKIFSFIFLFLFFSIPVFCQEGGAPELTAKGRSVYKGDFKISSGEVRYLLYDNKPALKAYNWGKGMEITSYIVAISGGVLFLYEIGLPLWDKDAHPDPILTGVGIGVVGVGFLIGYLAAQKIDTAIELYNSANKNKTAYQLQFGLNSTGIGLTLKF